MKAALALLLAAGALASGGDAAGAAAPAIVLVDGPPLPRAVAIADQGRISPFFAAVAAAPVVPRSELTNRPRLRLSLFWGSRWSDYLAAGKSPEALRAHQVRQELSLALGIHEVGHLLDGLGRRDRRRHVDGDRVIEEGLRERADVGAEGG